MVDHGFSRRSAGHHGAGDQSSGRLAARCAQSEAAITDGRLLRQRRGSTKGNVVMRSTLCTAAILLIPVGGANAAMWGPTWSELSGSRYHKATLDRRPAIIKSVDGRNYTDRIVKIEPGRRTVVLQSIKRQGFRGSD